VTPVPCAVAVGPVSAQDTWPLRRQVLRPHQRGDAVVLGGDEHPCAAHVGARDASGALVGIATVSPQAPPWDPARAGAWRLRGMATEEGRRGEGIGHAVLRAAVRHARAAGGTLVWCNARTGALRFYAREGFAPAAERYVDPELGPHVPMQLDLEEERHG
jgi:GNAT superfamily N-acetyltransferase